MVIDDVRALGLPMRGRCFRKWVGWTTDVTKAEAARALGATLNACTSPSGDPRFSGWDVVVSDPPEDDGVEGAAS